MSFIDKIKKIKKKYELKQDIARSDKRNSLDRKIMIEKSKASVRKKERQLEKLKSSYQTKKKKKRLNFDNMLGDNKKGGLNSNNII